MVDLEHLRSIDRAKVLGELLDEIERLRTEVSRLRRDCRQVDIDWSDANAADNEGGEDG